MPLPSESPVTKPSGRPEPDYAKLDAVLLEQAHWILAFWMPGGIISGDDYLCGNAERPLLAMVDFSLSTGAWHEFPENSKSRHGIGMIDLCCYIQRTGRYNAYLELNKYPYTTRQNPKGIVG